MATRGRYHDAEQIIEEMYGYGYAELFYPEDRASYERENAGRKGTDRGRNSENAQVKNGKSSRDVDKAALKRMDADYLAAVERNDMATAQRMVDEAAKAAGYNLIKNKRYFSKKWLTLKSWAIKHRELERASTL